MYGNRGKKKAKRVRVKPAPGGGYIPKPVRDRKKPLTNPPARKEMENGIKEMIKATRGGALSEPLDSNDDGTYDRAKFIKNVKKLQGAITLLDTFQNDYLEYLKDALMAYKLSAPTSDVELPTTDDGKESIADTVVDSKLHLEELLDVERERADLLEKLKYEMDSINYNLFDINDDVDDDDADWGDLISELGKI